MIQRVTLLLIAGLFAACSTLPSPAERRTHADTLAAVRGWQGEVIPAGRFNLISYAPQYLVQASRLTVYIEGDGFAWLNNSTPSTDPTPRDPLGLRLALAQPAGNVAYLGRPCQYGHINPAECPQRYWTQARLAPEVIAATDKAIDVLVARFGATRLTLVGYSGGGAVAALLAARRNDVDRLITVASNLDHRAWTTHHGVQPLSGSLNPADEVDKLRRVDQWHLVGSEDRVVPPWLASSFAERFSPTQRIVVEVKSGFDHQCCWAEQWPSIWGNVTQQ